MTESLTVIFATGCTKRAVLTGRSCRLGVSERGNNIADTNVSAYVTNGLGVTIGGTGCGNYVGSAYVTALVEYPSTVSGVAECEVVEHNTAVLSGGITGYVDAVNGIGKSSKL